VLQLRAGTWFCAALDAGLSFSRAGELTVFETRIAAGPALVLERGRWAFEGAVTAGVLLHSYSLDSAGAADPSGTRAGPILSAPFRVSVAVLPQLVLGLRAAVGLTSAYTHSLGPAVLWQRGPVFGELGVLLSWQTRRTSP
jgi:hypothetical protein